MISRRTARSISEIYEKKFHVYHKGYYSDDYYTVDVAAIYDFLFDHNYPAWLCNLAKGTLESKGTRKFKEFIMRLHTGESVVESTLNWTWIEREQLGQQYLYNLA